MKPKEGAISNGILVELGTYILTFQPSIIFFTSCSATHSDNHTSTFINFKNTHAFKAENSSSNYIFYKKKQDTVFISNASVMEMHFLQRAVS